MDWQGDLILMINNDLVISQLTRGWKSKVSENVHLPETALPQQ